jgi:glucose dehydrogenase
LDNDEFVSDENIAITKNGSIYMATTKAVYSVDAESGNINWKFDKPESINVSQPGPLTLTKQGVLIASYCQKSACNVLAFQGDSSSLAIGNPVANLSKWGGDAANTGRTYQPN